MAEIPNRTGPGHTVAIPVVVSPGELIDKLTILDIKKDRLNDAEDLRGVRTERKLLETARRQFIAPSAELDTLTAELRAINVRLWDIEDDIRTLEQEGRFDDAFIALARAVYKTNDRRAAVKHAINRLLDAAFYEAKSHFGRTYHRAGDG